MTSLQLTDPAKAASILTMGEPGMAGQERSWRGFKGASMPKRMCIAVALVASLGACITVKAPDKPIVIELNINIRQEVVYRLAQDADKTITENAEIF